MELTNEELTVMRELIHERIREKQALAKAQAEEERIRAEMEEFFSHYKEWIWHGPNRARNDDYIIRLFEWGGEYYEYRKGNATSAKKIADLQEYLWDNYSNKEIEAMGFPGYMRSTCHNFWKLFSPGTVK